MQTTITARHCDVPDSLRDHARDVVERLGAFAPRPVEATVLFEEDGPAHAVELRLHVSHGEMFVARGEGPDHRTALDRAEERLRRQVERSIGRRRSGRHSAPQPEV